MAIDCHVAAFLIDECPNAIQPILRGEDYYPLHSPTPLLYALFVAWAQYGLVIIMRDDRAAALSDDGEAVFTSGGTGVRKRFAVSPNRRRSLVVERAGFKRAGLRCTGSGYPCDGGRRPPRRCSPALWATITPRLPAISRPPHMTNP